MFFLIRWLVRKFKKNNPTKTNRIPK